MPLETATYIPDLVTSNPAHTDGLSQADAHMRLLKSTIKATFPNFTDVALASTQAELDAAVAATVTGTAPARFDAGTSALPGLTPIGDTDTGFFSPAADQIGISLNGVQVALLAGTALVTTLGIGAGAIASSGAYSGGTGQLVPIGAVLEWYDDTLPAEGGYCWANGQIIASANTVAPVLLARWGAKFGGNGTTTMGVPDRRETVAVGKSTMGGAAARGPLSNFATTVLNALIGSQSSTLLQSDLPNVAVPLIGTAGAVTVSGTLTAAYQGATFNTGTAGNPCTNSPNTTIGFSASGTFTPAGNSRINGNVTQTAVATVGPRTVCNFILRLG